MRRLFRWTLILGLLVGLPVGAAYPAYQWWKQRSLPFYRTAAVTRGRVEQVVNSTGTVKPVRSVSVGAFVSGPIKEVFVDFNSKVTEGQVLALIDRRLLEATVARDEAGLETQDAELARVESLLQQAKNNEARARRLQAINRDYLSDTEMDQFLFNRKSLEAQRRLALASIDQAKANLQNSKANLGYTEIKAPVSGIVVERKIDPGQTVASSFQTPELFVLAPEMEQRMYVFASVDEADVGLIHTAREQKRPVTFTVDAYPHDLFQGKIHQVRKNSTTTQNVVTYPVVIEAPNPGMKLMPGMTASISFQINIRDGVLLVPAAALRFAPVPAAVHPDDRRYLDGIPGEQPEAGVRLSASQKAALAKARSRRIVWVQEGPWLRARPVTLGLIDNQGAELLEGDLEEGQEVVTGLLDLFTRGRP